MSGFVNPRMGQVSVADPHDPLGAFAHWVAYGSRPGGGLNVLPGQIAASFDPRSRAGLANIASLFAGGPGEGGTLDVSGEGAAALGRVPGQFEPYSLAKAQAGGHVVFREGNKLDNYPPTMTKQLAAEDIIGRAQHNPFIKASAGKRAAAEDRLNQLDAARVQAVRKMADRQKMDQKLGSAPMAGKPSAGYQEHDAALVHGPSVINHPAFIRNLLQRRYQAALGHNHLN